MVPNQLVSGTDDNSISMAEPERTKKTCSILLRMSTRELALLRYLRKAFKKAWKGPDDNLEHALHWTQLIRVEPRLRSKRLRAALANLAGLYNVKRVQRKSKRGTDIVETRTGRDCARLRRYFLKRGSDRGIPRGVVRDVLGQAIVLTLTEKMISEAAKIGPIPMDENVARALVEGLLRGTAALQREVKTDSQIVQLLSGLYSAIATLPELEALVVRKLPWLPAVGVGFASKYPSGAELWSRSLTSALLMVQVEAEGRTPATLH